MIIIIERTKRKKREMSIRNMMIMRVILVWGLELKT